MATETSEVQGAWSRTMPEPKSVSTTAGACPWRTAHRESAYVIKPVSRDFKSVVCTASQVDTTRNLTWKDFASWFQRTAKRSLKGR